MYSHVEGIRRNYPYWPSTFGSCAANNCTNSARGGGLCAVCHEKKLAKYVGADHAKRYHDSVKVEHAAYLDMKDAIEVID